MGIRNYDVDAPLVLLDDPVAQWLDWEEQANLIGFRASTAPVEVDVVRVARDRVELHVLPGAPPEIVDRFVHEREVSVARHPLNRDPGVAWQAEPVRERWSARFTSSRTLAMPGSESGSALFSLKLSTDHPHPDFHQPEKTKLREEALDAVAWVRRLAEIDAIVGPIDEVLLVTEVLVVLEAGGETGLMVRDLRMFQDGHHYLPALSLPFVGPQVARALGEDFDALFGAAFAAAAGRQKARLFARYGLWYETPNPQNLLIQLSPSLHPTGRLVFRDVGDGECATDAFACPRDIPWTRLTGDLRLETANSFWAFDAAGDHAIASGVLERWHDLHDAAYFAELEAWFPELAPSAATERSAQTDHWNAALRSDLGAEAIARAFARRAVAAHA